MWRPGARLEIDVVERTAPAAPVIAAAAEKAQAAGFERQIVVTRLDARIKRLCRAVEFMPPLSSSSTLNGAFGERQRQRNTGRARQPMMTRSVSIVVPCGNGTGIQKRAQDETFSTAARAPAAVGSN